MIRRQSIRTFAYFAMIILTAASGGVLWLKGNPLVVVAARAKDPLWREIPINSLDALTSNPQSRIAPQHYKAFQLNETALTALLANAPMEFTEAAKDPRNEIMLPMPDGSFARFRFVESPIMEPKLAAQFPEIKTYLGWGIDDPSVKTRFDRTSAGFHAIILSPEGASLISTLVRGDTGAYASYFLRDAPGDGAARCEAVKPGDRPATQPDVDRMIQAVRGNNSSAIASTGVVLRTYRLAVAATAEYTAANGGTVTRAMDAIIRTINEVNAIFERDLAVRFSLVGANSSLVFTDPMTDPYRGGPILGAIDLANLVDDNQAFFDGPNSLGANDYDIGHVFHHDSARHGGAGVPGVCNGEKASAASVEADFTPGGFFLIVAHEIAHQFGAYHTFNGTDGNCSYRDEDSDYEPGSGSTIMAYPGSCDSDDLQSHRDPYFHGMSILQMKNFIAQNGGCAVTTNINNTHPTVNRPEPIGSHYYIPDSTPFTLKASGSDAEDANLTYCWEQTDHGSPGPPTGDRGGNPLFRSLWPESSPSRTFPRISQILDGMPRPGETLPTTNRHMRFIVTARDNNPLGGGTDHDTILIYVQNTPRPFAVTRPAIGEDLLEGSSFTVRWDVVGTNQSPFDAANVRILLSTDGGHNFPITLAGVTPNDGIFTFTVPHLYAPSARIKVEATNHLFFNISAPFEIIPKPTITATGNLEVACGGEVTAQVATIADERDVLSSLMVTTTTSPLPTGVALSFTNDKGVISATAIADCISYLGAHPITLQVTNRAGLTASTTFNLTVKSNPPPTLGNYSNATVVAGKSIVVSPSAPPADPNGNLSAVTVSPLNLPGGSGTLSVDKDTGNVTIPTTRFTQLGIRQIRIRVTDSCGYDVWRDFFLDIVNSPPSVTPNGSSVHTTQGGTPLAPVAIATVSDRQDLSGDLAVSATAPAGLSVSVTNSSGAIMASATATCAVAPGAYNATLTVTDSAVATATATFQIVVDPNPPPILGKYNNTGVTVGGSVLIVPTVPPSDPNNTISLSVFPGFLPNGGLITINQASGPSYGRVTVSTGPNTPVGKYPVQVTAEDACGVTTTKSFELTVRSAACPTEQWLTFVADTDNNRVQRFDGSSWTWVGVNANSGLGQFKSPEAVAAGNNGGTIYVADTGNNRILWTQNAGATWAVFANGAARGLAVDRDGNLYVSETQDNRVVRYRGGVPGQPFALATGGSGAGQVSNPNGLAIDCRMNLYIADTGNNRILRIETADAAAIPNAGTVVAGSGAGLNPAQVTAPQGVAVDDAGDLYVADTGNNRVLLITSAPAPGVGAALCTLGTQLGQVDSPEGVTVAAYTIGPLAGMTTLVVSDTDNDRIQGARLPIIGWLLLPPPAGGGPGSGMGQFKRPSKIR